MKLQTIFRVTEWSVHWELNPVLLSSKLTFPVKWAIDQITVQSKWMATWQSQQRFYAAKPLDLYYTMPYLCMTDHHIKTQETEVQVILMFVNVHVSLGTASLCQCSCWLWSQDFCALFSLAVSWSCMYPTVQNAWRPLVFLASCQWDLHLIKVSAPS